MSFTDYLFFPYFLVFVLFYYLLPKKGQWIVLLLGSTFFYLTYGAELFPFACGAVLVSWVGALLMQRQYERLGASTCSPAERQARSVRTRKVCRLILLLSIAAIMGVLVYTKLQSRITEIPILNLANWFFSKVYRKLARWFLAVPFLSNFVAYKDAVEVFEGNSFFVPLGISYYTMSLVGYLADVYWKKEKAERNPLRLALFALYFPKILEGPISKHRLLATQLSEPHRFDYTQFCHGLQRMLWGYFKKLCIADRLNLMVSEVYGSDCGNQGGSILLVTAIFGAFWLYCDFSGCMDIALGMSEALGIKVEENFNHPFASKSAAEFWRRWHITLGIWFKDYIYMPLVTSPKLAKLAGLVKKHFGRRAAKEMMNVIPLTIVWLLTGLWHGTGMTYIIWGLYWGALIILSTVFAPEIAKLNKALHLPVDSAGFQVFRKVRTFFLFVIGRILTMPSDLLQVKTVFTQICTDFRPWLLVDQSLYSYGLNGANFRLVLLLIVFLLLVEHRQEKGLNIRNSIDGLALPIRWIIYLAGIFFVLIFGIYGVGYDQSAFIYMNY